MKYFEDEFKDEIKAYKKLNSRRYKMARIEKKRMAINNPYDMRIRYIVDKVYIFPSKKKAKEFIEKTKRK